MELEDRGGSGGGRSNWKWMRLIETLESVSWSQCACCIWTAVGLARVFSAA